MTPKILPFFFFFVLFVEAEKSSKWSFLASSKSRLKSDDPCEKCKTVVANVHDELKDATKIEKFRKKLLNLCDDVHMSIQCKSMIENSFGQFIQFIIPYTSDTGKICKMLHCSPEKPWKKEALLLAKQVEKWRKKARKGNGLICNECLWVARQLHTAFLDEQFQQQVIDQIQSLVCPLFQMAQEECNRLADQIVHIFLGILAEQLHNARAICTQMQLCSTKKPFPIHKDKDLA